MSIFFMNTQHYVGTYFHILGIVRNMLHNVFQMGFFGQRVTIPSEIAVRLFVG